jgi:hypothetical protein
MLEYSNYYQKKSLSKLVKEQINCCMIDIKNIYFTIFSQDLSINHYSWIESIGEEELEQLKNLNI